VAKILGFEKELKYLVRKQFISETNPVLNSNYFKFPFLEADFSI